MKIAIQAPPYHRASGGIRVLHRLGHLCHDLGHEVDMRSSILCPDWPPYSQTLEEWDLLVLPEIAPASLPSDGNVVRWALYHPGVLAGPAVYPKHEMVWAFCDAYLDTTRAAAPGRDVWVFFLPACDFPGQGDEKPERDICTYWQGKGPRVEPPEPTIEITRGWPASREELVCTLMRSRTVYSCDRMTAINEEAQLLGAEVRVWDGDCWRPYFNPNAASMIMGDQHADVSQFLVDCAKHFGIHI